MKNFLKVHRNTVLGIVVILGFTLFYFHRFFWPQPNILYTVEPIGSDVWGFYFPLKSFLSTSLKAGNIPLWSPNMGGLAVLGEGQIGLFYLPNLIYYYLLPTWVAWNLNYLLAFFLLASGTFLFARHLKISTASSLLSSISFAFGGYFIARMVHTAPLQVMSLMPWMFLSSELLWKRVNIRRFLFFVFVFCQQIFAGHLQWFLIAFLGYWIYKGASLVLSRERGLTKKFSFYFFGVVVALAICSVQLFPTIEYLKASTRSSGFEQDEASITTNSLLNLYRFVNPSYFGFYKNPATKIIPNVGLSWEEETYIGVVPLLLLVLVFIRKKNVRDISLGVLLVISLLLVLGKFSPLSFIHKIPPFSFFRMPSRYLMLTTFAVSILAARSLDFLAKNIKHRFDANAMKLALIAIVAVAVFDISRFGYNYHSFVPVKDALAPPKTISYLKPGMRVYSPFSSIDEWRRAYSMYGYGDTDTFLYMRNLLLPSAGQLWNVATLFNSAGFKPSRQIDYSIINTDDDVLDIYSVDYVISIEDLDREYFEEVEVVKPTKSSLAEIKIYKNIDKLERFRIAGDYQVVNSKETIRDMYKESGADRNVTLLEDEILELKKGERNWEVSVIKDEDVEIHLNVETDNKSLLVVADSYYPGWKAYVCDPEQGTKSKGQRTKNVKQTEGCEETEIYPANLNQRAVIVPQGESQVVFKYEPESFKWGLRITTGSLLLLFAGTLGLFAFRKVKNN